MRSKINTLKNKLRLILFIFSVFIFTSCEDSGQIDGVALEPSQDEYVGNNLSPGGQNLGHVGDLYYNLINGPELDEKFWRFNYAHLNGIAHNGPNSNGVKDMLSLYSYQNSYYVPSTNFYDANCLLEIQENENGEIDYDVPISVESNSECEDLNGIWFGEGDIAFGYSDGVYEPISGLDLTTEVTESSDDIFVESSFDLKTPSLSVSSPFEQMKWSLGENIFSISAMDQLKDTLTVEYSYNYSLNQNFVPIDTVLNSIMDDMIIISDFEEILNDARTYSIFDTL